MLFVPGDRPDRFAKAAASGADAVILDLEDAVAVENRPQARAAIAVWLAEGVRGVPTWVRINSVQSNAALADLAAVAPRSPMESSCPKRETAPM